MRAVSGEDSQDTGGLSPQYHTYERQKCFIAYTEQAQWSEDLLSACREVLSRPKFNLEPDYARKHFYPDVPLRQKALELIANARYGIYDLSYWRDEKGKWQMPCNVFIELGMAIALNRPTLLLRHASNRELELPECLKSVSGHILEFSGETTLKRVLDLPQWVNTSPDRDWWNRYCIFGGRTCEYREAHPRARQWAQKTLRCHISDGSDVDRDDFRGVIEEVLGRFTEVTFVYLDALPLAAGYSFLLCTHCQTVRSTPFAIYRITPHTSPETFIAIGISIALEKQFEYKIPKILLTENAQDVPSLLSGYEVFVARSDTNRKTQLRTFIPTVMQKVRETAWKPRPFPFQYPDTSVWIDIGRKLENLKDKVRASLIAFREKFSERYSSENDLADIGSLANRLSDFLTGYISSVEAGTESSIKSMSYPVTIEVGIDGETYSVIVLYSWEEKDPTWRDVREEANTFVLLFEEPASQVDLLDSETVVRFPVAGVSSEWEEDDSAEEEEE
jgi:hypothetical protein